jgi:hypothetical protein
MDLQLDVNEAFLAALISHLRNLNFEIPEASYRKSFTAVHSYRLCSFLTPLSFDTYPFMSCLIFFSQVLSLFLVREFLAQSLQQQ